MVTLTLARYLKINAAVGMGLAFVLFGTLSGCGTSPAISANSIADDAAPNAAVFEDDADPTVAALPFVEDELLVQPWPGADEQALEDVYAEAGATRIDRLDNIQLDVVAVTSGDQAATAERLAESGLVEGVHKNYIFFPDEIPNDSQYYRQAHLSRIDAPQAWDVTVGSDDVIVAVVDTGVNARHPDLEDKIIDGWNVYDDNADYDDVIDHGTLVAGIAAASSDNRVGVAGVTWGCPLIVVRAVGRDGSTTARHLAAGILWAAQRGARVINVSFAPLWSNRVVRSAAEQVFNRGALVVISAGNSGGKQNATGYPEGVFVGAIAADNQIAPFSDRGRFVDLVAPGTAIWSTASSGTYRAADGTSFAAPIVSGAAALLWSVNPDLRPVSIVEALTDTATDLGARGQDSTYGYGAISVADAVTATAAMVIEADTMPPTIRITRPAERATMSGRYVVVVEATDRQGVADVVLSIDDIPFATDTRSPYRFVVDTGMFDAGAHELTCTATDHSGNTSTTPPRRVTFRVSSTSVASQLDAAFRSPAENASVSGDVTIEANVSAQAGLATVEWFVDGEPVFAVDVAGKSAGVSYVWRTATVARGSHTTTLVVTDSRGRRSTASLNLNKT